MPPPGNPTQCRESSGVGIEQHLVPLAGVGHKPLFAPVELERLARLERQRHQGVRYPASTAAPRADEGGELAVSPV